MNILDDRRFAQILQGAIAGNHQDLETILGVYEPVIRKHSCINGVFDIELNQYLLIHIALHIHKFVI